MSHDIVDGFCQYCDCHDYDAHSLNCTAEREALASKPYDDLHQQLATITQERDALWEATRALVRAGDALYVKGKFADQDYWAPCNWATVVEESDKLLTPSGEAGKGGGA